MLITKMEKSYQFNAHVYMVDLIDSLYFGEAFIATLDEQVGGIQKVILGKRKGGCPEASIIKEDFVNGKDITLDFNKSSQKRDLLSLILGAEKLSYDGIVKINNVPKYSFVNLFREKGNQRTILKSDLKEIK